ncbi:hypothetical protein IW262DRAFT_1408355 [Armillaria fumosa]|nr:hypothetical protein IW262DRAFT_1408355 [Armillaria fumosa]
MKTAVIVPTMPAGQTGLTLHSPSQIIGTPFDVESPRFEYPFPESSSSPKEPLSNIASAASSISSLQSPLNHITPIHLLQPDIPVLQPARTKVRTEMIPIPPGLVEKRHRWSIGERKTSDDSSKRDQVSERDDTQSELRQPNSSGGREKETKGCR